MIQTSNDGTRRGRFLMVIPTNIEVRDGRIIVCGDFAEYLRFYLEAFDEVVVACPPGRPGSFPLLEPLEAIDSEGRLRIIVLPEPYREDRYLLARSSVAAMLREEIAAADIVTLSPHSAFDWSTLAADLCIAMGKPYAIESDWNLQQVNRSDWSKLKPGINKLRRYLWMRWHHPKQLRAMRHSAVALLNGWDVFEAYRTVAPNAHMVEKYCVAPDERIADAALGAKLAAVAAGAPLKIAYAGRAIAMKGPTEWLEALRRLRDRGVAFHATWFGDGEMLPTMQTFVREHGLGEAVTLAGRVERRVIFETLFESHLFLFCHLTRESPRNLVEALTAGAPIVGFGSAYSEYLAGRAGGGRFVETGDVDALVEVVAALDADRGALAALISDAAASGRTFDREQCVRQLVAHWKGALMTATA